MAEFQKTVGFLRQAAQTPGKLGAAQLLLLQRDDEVKLAREVGGEREDFLACAGLARLGQPVLLEPALAGDCPVLTSFAMLGAVGRISECSKARAVRRGCASIQ
ncbi:MAG: hypothetical protein ACLUHG_00170 [Sutterella wadsworthensis]